MPTAPSRPAGERAAMTEAYNSKLRNDVPPPGAPDDREDRAGSWRRWPGRHPLLSVLAAGLALAVLALAAVWLTLPDVSGLATAWPERTAFMELRLRQASEAGRELAIRYRPVPLARIPQHLQRATLAGEDAEFYRHRGFDWEQIRDAARRAWRERSVTRGASTITQQLARNLYLSPSRNPVRKLREALIAWKLERTVPKRRILELYLNVVELGPGIFGVEAASRHYFGTSVSAITPLQAAQLVATLPWPLRNNPATDTPPFRRRTNLIYRLAFGPIEERLEIIPPPESIRVTPPPLPGAAIDTVRPGALPRGREAGDTTAAGASGAAGTDTAAARRDTASALSPPSESPSPPPARRRARSRPG